MRRNGQKARRTGHGGGFSGGESGPAAVGKRSLSRRHQAAEEGGVRDYGSGQACSTKGVRISCLDEIEEAARGAWAQGRTRPHRSQIAGGPAKHPAALASTREGWRDSSGRFDRWCLVCGRGSVGLRGLLGPHAQDVPHAIGQFVVRSGHLPRNHQTHRENQTGTSRGGRRDLCPATDLVGRCILRPR